MTSRTLLTALQTPSQSSLVLQVSPQGLRPVRRQTPAHQSLPTLGPSPIRSPPPSPLPPWVTGKPLWRNLGL
ncbi:hypothetical protein DPMN_014173 [Dreissena polymorpha]|uniref:Uncharacterized protein n=1 Tax=Dreissena polymorpha TaxID=45954 RepID=A0A9D4S4Z3_DREPO|nr:hypothetical protein DPMN_014173 [Dreissena polymorpha]